MTTVLTLVGSLRSASINHAIAREAAAAAPEGVQVVLAEGLDRLPFYSEDIDAGQTPEAVTRLLEQVENADAVLVVTPEYNGGLPAVVKNAIDWTSRPYGRGALAGKPVGAIGASLSKFGGQWAQQEALKAASIAGAASLEQPTASLVIGDLGESPAQHESVHTALHSVLSRLDRDAKDAAAA